MITNAGMPIGWWRWWREFKVHKVGMYKLTPQQKKKFKEIAKKYDLNFLALFGSQATGLTHPKSDFDIAYSPKKEIDYGKEYEMNIELMRVFKSPDVEVVNTHKGTPLLNYYVAFQSQLLAETTIHSFAQFQTYSFKIYIEAKPLFKLQREYIKEYLK